MKSKFLRGIITYIEPTKTMRLHISLNDWKKELIEIEYQYGFDSNFLMSFEMFRHSIQLAKSLQEGQTIVIMKTGVKQNCNFLNVRQKILKYPFNSITCQCSNKIIKISPWDIIAVDNQQIQNYESSKISTFLHSVGDFIEKNNTRRK